MEEIMDDHLMYLCRNCRNPLAYGEDLLSRTYRAKSGPAYLFQHVMNVVVGPKMEKELITGRYTIASIYCSRCRQELGWSYVQADDVKQRFKEGKFVVEKLKIIQQI